MINTNKKEPKIIIKNGEKVELITKEEQLILGTDTTTFMEQTNERKINRKATVPMELVWTALVKYGGPVFI